MFIFKETLKGKRIILKINHPSIVLAEKMFTVINSNRKHLRPWFPWEKETKKMEDSLKYLFSVEDLFKTSTKIEYGIYLKGEYIGNIGAFSISEKNKSAEIGYWLSSSFIRKGYMTEAVKLVEKEAFRVGLNRLFIRCDERNLASAAVARKCNYFFEGCSREDAYSHYFLNFRNTLNFSKLKSEYKK